MVSARAACSEGGVVNAAEWKKKLLRDGACLPTLQLAKKEKKMPHREIEVILKP